MLWLIWRDLRVLLMAEVEERATRNGKMQQMLLGSS
jgi:hypothetical protein